MKNLQERFYVFPKYQPKINKDIENENRAFDPKESPGSNND